MLPCLCVLWSGEGCRVEINVKLTEPVVYIWGERRKVGGAGALGNWTGLSRGGCVCVHASCGAAVVEF